MKTIICLLILITTGTCVHAQTKRVVKKSLSTQHASPAKVVVQPTTNTVPPEMRENVTERYLNGTARKSQAKAQGDSSPFASGIHPANNAAKTFDTVALNNANSNTAGNSTAVSGDTVFNANTVQNGNITTNSGAVDRSGQTQFGQTNWGDGRGTVGESQWTVPPPITASFSKEFPAANNAAWSRSNVDTSVFSARYKSGETWVTTNYNAAGERLDMRTEVPMIQPPRPVGAFLAKQPATFHAVTINKLQVQGKADVYEIQTQTGKTVYINNDGAEVVNY